VESDKLLVDNETQLTTNNSPLYTNRYDVTILVNGLPLVHIELKKRGVDIKEAFNQIYRYNRESFWAGCGLFEYVQLFVISNGTYTKYYSNTTRNQHLKDSLTTNHSKLTTKKPATVLNLLRGGLMPTTAPLPI